MSRSEISFGGILQPLLESLAKNPKRDGYLAGQDVVIPARKDLRAVIALDSNNDTHLLIAPAASDDARFSRFDLRGLRIENKEWVIADNPAQKYLDIACSTGEMPSFRRPFLRFSEDVLFEISRQGVSPTDAVYRTGLRWKRFWSADLPVEMTKEWLHGILGELSFLRDLIQRTGPTAVRNWTGPLGEDHDFQAGTDLGIEVKASVEMPFKIQCNIRQLDQTIFKKLYIACYKVNDSELGWSVPGLVKEIENLLGSDDEEMDGFYERLAAAGYSRQLEPVYEEHAASISPVTIFRVDETFPKITESSFINPPDHRISAIRYSLQLTGLSELTPDIIGDDLKLFGKPSK